MNSIDFASVKSLTLSFRRRSLYDENRKGGGVTMHYFAEQKNPFVHTLPLLIDGLTKCTNLVPFELKAFHLDLGSDVQEVELFRELLTEKLSACTKLAPYAKH